MRTKLCAALMAALTLSAGAVSAQESEGQPAPYDLKSIECGELDNESGLRTMRPSHIAGEDLDILCKVTVALSAQSKGAPKAHTVKLSVTQGTKTSYEQVRDARVLNVGSRILLFVIPAEKLPTEAGKVTIRAELSKPVNKPASHEVTYSLTSED
ncbi:MAG: hypothetical protein U1A78_04805 [Polyangia bacterium]